MSSSTQTDRKILTVNVYPRQLYRWYHIERREWEWILSPNEFGRTNLPLKDLIGWLKEHFVGCKVKVHKYPFDISCLPKEVRDEVECQRT